MLRKDIEPGKFYRVRLDKYGGEVRTDLVRVERIEQPRYDGDKAIVVATRFQVRGPIETRHMPRSVLAPEEPDEKTRRIIAIIEEGACPD